MHFMVIETWLIVSGVAVMTLIILDGKRKKKQHPRAGAKTPEPVDAGNADESASNVAFIPDSAHQVVSETGLAIENQRRGSHLGVATQIHGDITANESVSIKGRVVGTIKAHNQFVQLASSSIVNASLEGAHIVIDGHLEGDIHASQRLTLMSGAKVRGTISTNGFACHAGASVNGSVLPGQGESVVFPSKKPAV